jgi:hypothetical protein
MFMANTYTTGFQGYPASVATDGQGNFVVVWQSPEDGDDYGIMGRRWSVANDTSVCRQQPMTGCRQQTAAKKGLLLIRDRSPDTRDAFSWSWTKGGATDVSDFGDPPTTTDYVACIYDESGAPRQVFRARAPAGGTCGTKPCWKLLAGKGFNYSDNDKTPDGLKKLQLRAGVEGRAQVKAGGTGVRLTPPPLPLALPARVQLQASNGACWEAVFSAAGVVRNTDVEFRGQAD